MAPVTTDAPEKPPEAASFPHDGALLAAMRAGEARAFEELVRTFTPRLLAVARRLVGDQAAAEDCVQEAFLNAFRGLDGFEGRAGLGTWLHRITVNTALARLRARRAKREESIDHLLPRFDEFGFRVEPSWSASRGVEELVDDSEVAALVRAKIEELPESYRQVIVLRDLEELSTGEVASLLGENEGTVKVRLHRARMALKTKLEPLLRGDGMAA